MNIITTENKPVQIDRAYFRARYGQNFPDLLSPDKDTFIDSNIEDVYSMFYGVSELWNHLERKTYVAKTQMCYGLLVAWYIADLYPNYSDGVVSSGGGVPIASKKIGNTTITFGSTETKAGSKNNADLLRSLKSNVFGAKAYMMIKSSGKINVFLTIGGQNVF